jgi:membrane protease YdiL (CAAX protease family)
VISAGAGFHEELIFRVIVMGGLAWLLTGLTGPGRAWIVALVLSSLVFSLAHHVGPVGEPFTFAAFVYRTLAGVFFALVYHVRGFAVAAWTHALYDVYVLSLTGG